MAETTNLDQIFHLIMNRMVKSGQAPHYTEIAAELNISMEEGIMPLNDLVKLFSGNYFRRRMDSDWVSRSREYAREMVATFDKIGKTGPFWQLSR